MLTNLQSDQCTITQLVKLYRARWAVEIQFRAWKQSCNLGKALNQKSNEHHLTALVLAEMIAHQLGMKVAQLLGEQVGRWQLSYEKLYDLLAVSMVKSESFIGLCDFSPDIRHIIRDKRSRVSPIEPALNSLT